MSEKLHSIVGVKHNWETLFQEFVASGMSLSEFARYKGIRESFFFRSVKRLGWTERMKGILDKARQKAGEEAAGVIAARWAKQDQLWLTIERHAEALLERSLRKGTGSRDRLKPAQLTALASALEKALKARRLISGEATEVHEDRGGGSMHMAIVDFIRQRRAGQPGAAVREVQ